MGASIPSALAVFRLRKGSNLIGCSIGISAGFAPFKTLSTMIAAREPTCHFPVNASLR